MRVDCVIPIFRRLDCLTRTISTLLANTPEMGQLILVDDASKDGETEYWIESFARHYDYVSTVRHGTNTRFSAAANDGLALARTPFMALLNSDLILPPGWLDAMLNVMVSASDIAVVGCTHYAIGNGGGLLHSGFKGHAEMLPVQSRPYEADWVTGAVWLINQAAWIDVGPLREDVDSLTGIDYRHFESDREWCNRARIAGWKVMMSPFAVAHAWRASTPPDWEHT